jgi:TolA-binding protein
MLSVRTTRNDWKRRRSNSKQLVSSDDSHTQARVDNGNVQLNPCASEPTSRLSPVIRHWLSQRHTSTSIADELQQPAKSRATGLVCVAVFCGLLLSMFSQSGTAFAQEVSPEEAAAIREYRVAIAFQKKKLFAQAAVRWTQFLQKHPKDKRLPSAHLNLGVCQFGDRKFPEAAAVFRDVLAKYGGFEQRDHAQFNLGMCHYNVSLALQDTADAAKTEAEQKTAQAAAAVEFRKAAVEFDKLVKGFAKSVQLVDALFYQGECLSLAGDLTAAVPVYDRIVKQHAQAPQAVDAYYGLGIAYAELAQHENAAKTFDEFVKKFPMDERLDECRLRHGAALTGLERHADAEKLYQQVQSVATSPYAEYALYQLALCVQTQDRLPQAADQFESLPKRFPTGSYVGAALL